MNNLIVYQGKYGATEQYARWLSEELQLPLIPSTECILSNPEPGSLLLLGSSVYIGKLQLSDWLKKNVAVLPEYRLVLFVVSGTPLTETAKLFKYVKDSVPPSLFKLFRVFFLPGRLVYNKLSWRDRFMLNMGALLAGRKEGARMKTGYDDVKKEHLKELLSYLDSVSIPGTLDH